MTETYLLYVHYETADAWCVSETGEDQTFWLPKSQVSTDERNMLRNSPSEKAYEFEIPGWLATEKGLT